MVKVSCSFRTAPSSRNFQFSSLSQTDIHCLFEQEARLSGPALTPPHMRARIRRFGQVTETIPRA